MNFAFSNIKFKKHETESWLVVTGDTTNNSDKSYSSALFRVTLFTKNTPIGHTNFTVNGFSSGQTRSFVVEFYDLDYKLLSSKLRCEIFAEHAY
jgi:hypothetical protein